VGALRSVRPHVIAQVGARHILESLMDRFARLLTCRRFRVTFVVSILAVSYGCRPSEEPESPAYMLDAAAEARTLGETFARGFYTMDPALALSTLHPALSKLGVSPNIRGSGRSALLRLTPGTLEVFAASHNRDGRIDPETAVTDIRMLDVSDDVAVFELVAAEDWFDYYIGVRVGERWFLINCVFGGFSQLTSLDPTGDRQDINVAVESYAAAVAAADFDDFKAAVHLDFERRSVRSEQQKVWVEPETLETIRLDMSDSGDRPGYAVTFLSASQVTGAARIDTADRTEWVLLLKIDGTWLPVNSFWAGVDSSNG